MQKKIEYIQELACNLFESFTLVNFLIKKVHARFIKKPIRYD